MLTLSRVAAVILALHLKYGNIASVAKLFQFNYFQAEARLAARRQARYEARNIRMRELEKKQKEEDEVNNHGSMNHGSGSHSLIQHTSSTNSNHNNIHSGKSLVTQLLQFKLLRAEEYLKKV